MARVALCPVVFALVFAVPQIAEAQSPEMPEPLAIVVDADGKPMVQIASIRAEEANVLFDFGGASVFLFIHETGHFNGCCEVFFSEDNCTGDVYMTEWSANRPLEVMNQQGFVIAGPDATLGTYRVFRSTSTSVSPTFPESYWVQGSISLGVCSDLSPSQMNLLTAEEILPNPLEGYHGPTLANPERLLTIKGGTRLP